jgi:hypothetical protein
MGIPPSSCPNCGRYEPPTPNEVGKPMWCHCPRMDLRDLYDRICLEAFQEEKK